MNKAHNLIYLPRRYIGDADAGVRKPVKEYPIENLRINRKAWLLITISTMVIMFIMRVLPFQVLYLQNEKIRATITGLHPSGHATYSYMYTVKGNNYCGRCSAEDFGKQFEDVSAGDTLWINYIPWYPKFSTSDSISLELLSAYGDLIALTAILPIIILCVLHYLNILPPIKLFESIKKKSKRI